jgi:phage gp29-like protein
MSRLVDAYGRPVDTSVLKEEIAAPKLTSLRNPWWQTVASSLTPELLGAILQQIDMGDSWNYMTLAYEVEERWPHYFSVLSTRKLAVSGLQFTLEPATEDPQDVKIADTVREMLNEEMMAPLISDAMDAVSKSYSANEIQWDKSEGQWWPRKVTNRDARFFLFDRFTGQELRIYDMEDPAFGIPLPPYKFVVHRPNIKTGLPIKNGLARLALVPYLMQNYALRDWLAFAEVMGMPLRLGKYPTTAQPDEKAALLRAVSSIGVDAAAIVPNTMEITFEGRGTTTGGDKIFAGLVEYFDKALSKAVLGQTSTADGTPGKLGNDDAKENVREDIRQNDAQQMAATLRRDLVRPIVDLNFGAQPRGRYPKVKLAAETKDDLNKMSTALAPLIDRGLRVSETEIRSKFGLKEPDEGDDVLTPVGGGQGAPGGPGGGPGGGGPQGGGAKPPTTPKSKKPLPDTPKPLPVDDHEIKESEGNPDKAEKKSLEVDPRAGKKASRVLGPSRSTMSSMTAEEWAAANPVESIMAMAAIGHTLTDDQRLVLALAGASKHEDEIDKLNASALRGWRKTVGPMLAQIKSVAAGASTEAEFKAKLSALKFNDRALIDEVARLTFSARGLGDATDETSLEMSTASAEAQSVALCGDVSGHDFHGNQWVTHPSSGAPMAPASAMGKAGTAANMFRTLIHEQHHAKLAGASALTDQQIHKAVKAKFGADQKNHVAWYRNDMKKSGLLLKPGQTQAEVTKTAAPKVEKSQAPKITITKVLTYDEAIKIQNEEKAAIAGPHPVSLESHPEKIEKNKAAFEALTPEARNAAVESVLNHTHINDLTNENTKAQLAHLAAGHYDPHELIKTDASGKVSAHNAEAAAAKAQNASPVKELPKTVANTAPIEAPAKPAVTSLKDLGLPELGEEVYTTSSNVKSWKDSLSPEEKNAWSHWKGQGYIQLREKEAEGKITPTLKNLYAAVEKAPVHQGPLFRGMRNLTADEVKSMIKVGDVHTQPAMSSWSPDPNVAHGFSAGHSSGSPLFSVQFRLTHNSGIAKMCDLGGESEALIGKGAQFKVTHAAKYIQDGVWKNKFVVDLEEVKK